MLLGKMYSDGVGVPKDETEAVKWHQKAAEQGEDNAQNELTIHYMHGRGVPINLVIAYKWALLAAAKGNEYAGKNMLKLEDYLTPEQMEEGRKMASEFEERKPTKN
ncbi:MAG: tetratricopeptide repeat protein [Verrucomicrobiales bacterium]